MTKIQENLGLRSPRAARPRATPEERERAAEMFRAVGDPARLLLLEHLVEREASVSELADLAGQGLSTVSQQLRVLHRAGLVQRRREGKHIYYRPADGHVVALIRDAIAHAGEAPAGS